MNADDSRQFPIGSNNGPRVLPRAMLFDMDGTLTAPFLDFAAIRRETGVGNQPLLEAIARMDAAKRQAAEMVLHQHEDRCAAECVLNPGCRELIAWLKERNIRLAVVTRNSRKSAATVFERHAIAIDTLITRDDGVFKPAPEPLLLACKRLDVSPGDAWMIGDGSYDIAAGNAARMHTVWLSHGQPKDFDATPDIVVRDLIELQQMLQRCEADRV